MNIIRTPDPHSIVHRLILLLALTLAVPCALAQTEAPPAKLAAGAIQAQANGRIELRPDLHLPLFVEFDRSPALTKAMAAGLEARGIQTTQERSAAKATLSIRGDVVLMGGPVFYKGVKVAMGDVTEKTLATAASNRTTTPGEAANTAVGVALNVAALQAATTPFWSGLAVSRMADVLGEATGMKGAFNTALTGDPRASACRAARIGRRSISRLTPSSHWSVLMASKRCVCWPRPIPRRWRQRRLWPKP